MATYAEECINPCAPMVSVLRLKAILIKLLILLLLLLCIFRNHDSSLKTFYPISENYEKL
uniref:Ovule protein n=1 Tax=Heterorhabditis bacteriophora TaxID=37862 RepID=A0A1I7WX61_HETBA